MDSSRTAPRDDRGFTLVETIMALVVLGTIMLISITVISAAFRTLGDARETDVASNVGQARVEVVRSLAFDEVGTQGGSPAGSLAESETAEVQGISMQVTTAVEWVGSGSGLDVVPSGGDGVPGFFDPGVDYKLVTVTVTPEGGDNEVVYRTIVAPPNVAATEGTANLIVRLVRDEPSWALGSDTAFPRVYLHEAFGSLAGPLGVEEPLFADLQPETEYSVRLGPSADDTFDGTWAMSDPTISATVSAAVTSTQLVSIYRPITLEITAQSTTGDVLTDATLVVTDPATTTEHTFTADDMAEPGLWRITELNDGVPLRWGVYEYLLRAPGYNTGAPEVVQAPWNYPTEVVEATTITLEPVPTTEVKIVLSDPFLFRVGGATVNVSPANSPAYDVLSDANGQATLVLNDTETYDIEITTPYGFLPNTELTGVTSDDFSSSGEFLTLESPPDGVPLLLIPVPYEPFEGRYQYREQGTTDAWFEAPPNAFGLASVIVPRSVLGGWEARVVCPDDSATAAAPQSFASSTYIQAWINLPPCATDTP